MRLAVPDRGPTRSPAYNGHADSLRKYRRCEPLSPASDGRADSLLKYRITGL